MKIKFGIFSIIISSLSWIFILLWDKTPFVRFLILKGGFGLAERFFLAFGYLIFALLIASSVLLIMSLIKKEGKILVAFSLLVFLFVLFFAGLEFGIVQSIVHLF